MPTVGIPTKYGAQADKCQDKGGRWGGKTKNKQGWCWKLDRRGLGRRCRERLRWQPVGLWISSPMVRQRSAEAFAAAAAAAHRTRKREHWMWRRRGNEKGKGRRVRRIYSSVVGRLHRFYAGQTRRRPDSRGCFTGLLHLRDRPHVRHAWSRPVKTYEVYACGGS